MNKQTTYEFFNELHKLWSKSEVDPLEESLENNEKLIINIIQAVKKYNVINEVHDYLVDQVDKPVDKGGINRETFQYFVDLLIESE
ncbi:hypothetical protein [Paenibacillus taichungensis]